MTEREQVIATLPAPPARSMTGEYLKIAKFLVLCAFYLSFRVFWCFGFERF